MNESVMIPSMLEGQAMPALCCYHTQRRMPVPKWLNLFVSPRVVVRPGPGGAMDKAKMVRVFALGILAESEVKLWWEAMDTVPDHKVLSFNKDETGYLVTYHREPNEQALNKAISNVARYRSLRLFLGLPLRLLGLPRRS